MKNPFKRRLQFCYNCGHKEHKKGICKTFLASDHSNSKDIWQIEDADGTILNMRRCPCGQDLN